MPWAAAAVAVGAGVANYLANKSASERAMMIQQKNFQDWMNLNIPDPESQKIALQKFVQQGELDPQLEKAISADPSEFKHIISNPRYSGAQNRALSELENVGYSGGMRLQDKAALQESMMDSQTRDKSARAGIMDEAARRGTGGMSGFGLAARLQGQQAVADRQSNDALKVAAGAQDRALQSIMGAGKLAGDMENQDFGQQAQKAAAADKINMFNTENLRDVSQRNTGMLNRAQEMNLKEKQRVSDQNTQLSNAQEQYNKGLAQQDYDNRMRRLAGASGQISGMAANTQRQGEMLGNTISNVGSGVSNGITQNAFWDRYFDDQEKKKQGNGA